MRASWQAVSYTVLLSALLGSVAAIYEDQAGTFDWYKQHVGQPRSVAFVPGKERIYLTTQQNLLASLHTKAGSIAWRRKYTEHDPLDKAIALSKPPLVLAVSKGGKYLRAWDGMEGGFRWEALVFEGQSTAGPSSGCDIASVDLGPGKGQAVAVAASDTIKVLGASKGDEVWAADLELAGQAAVKLLAVHGESISVVAYTPGSADVYVSSFAAADGSHQDAEHLTAAAALGPNAAVSGSSIAIISSDGQKLCAVTLPVGAGAGSGVSCKSLRSVAPELSKAATDSSSSSSTLRLTAAAPGSFSLALPSAGVAIVSVTDSGVEQSHWFPGAMAATPAAAPASSTTAAASSLMVLASSSADGSSVQLQLLNAASGEVLETSTVDVPAVPYTKSGPAAHVVAAWLDTSKQEAVGGASSSSHTGKSSAAGSSGSSSSTGLSGCQLVLLWSDDELSFISGGKIAWSREEALASGTSNIIIDLPAQRTAAAAAAAATAGGATSGGLLGLLQDKERLKRWVRLQVLSVLVQFRMNTAAEKEEFYELRQALSDNNLPYRDTNGFRKLIVLLTAPGKVFALHSGDGRIIWTSSAPATAAGSGSSGSSPRQYLRVWRRFHDLTHAPQLVVITAGLGGAGSVVQVLNGHTGEQLQQQELPYSIDKVIPQHQPVHDGATEQYTFLLVEPPKTDDSSSSSSEQPVPAVHLLPDTPTTQQALASASSNLFFWLQQQQHGSSDSSSGDAAAADAAADAAVTTVLRGYGFEPSARPGGDGLLPVVPAWQVVLPGQLLGLAAKDPSEPVHSYVKVLGDRSLKYNYLNPNLIFIATGTPTAAAAALPADEQTVTVTLLNTVTGGVLHQQVHRGAAGPVYAVASENWVVYALRDVVNLRQQATVIELYDNSPHDLSIQAVLLGRTAHSQSISSYRDMTLEVLTQSFYLQHFITGLSVTQTKQGITTKQLLVRTISDQVYALDKRFLDPRRPLREKATPEEVEERLLPYNELVIFSSLQYVSQDKQVVNLRAVSVAPAVLESTTLVFAHGSDMFYSRISPAQNFDSLQSDFSYGLLVVALVALTGGAWFASYSSQQAMLKAKWE